MKKCVIGSVGIICFIAVILLCVRFWKQSDSDKVTSFKIGISVYNQYDTFVASLIEEVKREAVEKENETGIEIIVDIVNASGSQLEQNDQVEKFIKNNYDVICVNLVDRTDPTLIIDKVQSASIPIIFFNRELVLEDLKRYDDAYYVGAVTVEPGMIQGEIISNLYKKEREKIDKNKDNKLQYIMLEGEAGHQDAILRTEYSVNTIVQNKIKVEKLGYILANWNRDQARSKMDKLIDEFGNQIEVIICNNDDMALGVIDAYHMREIQEELPVIVGIDGTYEGLMAVKDGNMYGTAYNDVIGQGKSLLELSYSLVTKEKLPEDIVLSDDIYIRYSYQKITKENVEDYLPD